MISMNVLKGPITYHSYVMYTSINYKWYNVRRFFKNMIEILIYLSIYAN